jgi:cell division protein FtsB
VTRKADPSARQPLPRVPTAQRLLTILLLIGTAAVILNVLVGARGLPAVMKARRDHQAVSAELQRIRDENNLLRQEVLRLRSDPSAIEELARRELGFISPGERVFIVRDARPAGGK